MSDDAIGKGDEHIETVVAPRTPAVDDLEADSLTAPGLQVNRELSELRFHERVLAEATDDRTPLQVRVTFLGIITSNLDEFFMKRVGGLKQQVAAGVTERSPDGRTPTEQLDAVRAAVSALFDRQSRCYHEAVRPALAQAGIHVLDHDALSAVERDALADYFESRVMPTLTPLTFDGTQPFPFVSNRSLSLAVLTREAGDEEPRFSRVKVPANRPRLVPVPGSDGREGSSRFVPLEQIIAANLDTLFPGVEVLDHAAFRVVRNAEVGRNEDVAEGLIAAIRGVLRDRRFATVVRLDLEAGAPDAIRETLVSELDLAASEVYERPGPLDLRGLTALADLDRPDLNAEPWTPRPHPRFADGDRSVFAEIDHGDVLVHHPYHSFEDTVVRFLREAARDPAVLAIKCTIYRTSRDSPVIEALIDAVRNGTQVAVMVELTARFDEENNLRWVRRLEEEGVHVAYGARGLKAHSKVALVVREGDDGLDLYSHVGTGNYHSETAKRYTDLGVFTADPDVGRDLTGLFNGFTGHTRQREYRSLLVAPVGMREAFTERIRAEAAHGSDGRIVAKMNALEDPQMVRELYRASQAGVDIDLIVRGICRLRPGVEGVSETVRVHSIVGRFLEHSRVFHFAHDDPGWYVGSADWMTRNLDRRVEAAIPVTDPDHQAELRFVLGTMLADDRRRWTMDAAGSYERVAPDGEATVDTHAVLMERARETTPSDSPSGFSIVD